MLVVVLPLPLSLSMYVGEFDHGGGSGGGGGPAAAAVGAVAAVAAVEDNYWQKRPATRAPAVAWWHGMPKSDSRQHLNNQPTNDGTLSAAVVVAAAQQRDGGSSLAVARRRRSGGGIVLGARSDSVVLLQFIPISPVIFKEEAGERTFFLLVQYYPFKTHKIHTT